MSLNIKVSIDLDEFFERWGDDSLSTCINAELKEEIMKAVKNSTEYKEILVRQKEEMIKKLTG